MKIFMLAGILIIVSSIFMNCKKVDEEYLHPRAVIGNPSIDSSERGGIQPIYGREAAGIAYSLLKKKDIRNIQICRVTWIGAPLSGYLIDATGVMRDAKNAFTAFRIGIRDGSEERNRRFAKGEEFVFIAKGVGGASTGVWIPRCGPDCMKDKEATVSDECTDFEYYFLYKDNFDNLPADFQ